MKCHLDEFHSKEKIQINSSKRRFVPKTLHKNQEQGIKVKIILINFKIILYISQQEVTIKNSYEIQKVYKRTEFSSIASHF